MEEKTKYGWWISSRCPVTFKILFCHRVLKYPEVQGFFTVKLATGEKVNLYYLVIKIRFGLTFFAKWGEIYLGFRKNRKTILSGRYRVGIGSELDPGRNSPKLINHFPLIRFAYYGPISIKYVRESGKNQFRTSFDPQGPFNVTFRVQTGSQPGF